MSHLTDLPKAGAYIATALSSTLFGIKISQEMTKEELLVAIGFLIKISEVMDKERKMNLSTP